MATKQKPTKPESYEQWLARTAASVEATYSIMQVRGEATPGKLYVMPARKPTPAVEEDSLAKNVRLLRDLHSAMMRSHQLALRLLTDLEETL